MQKHMKTIYEGMMIVLVMITIITIWTENTYNSSINWIVWAVFFIDFLTRFYLSKEKWTFIKRNPFLIIAIIPFDQFFQVARIVRVIYLFRIKTITKYYIAPYVNKHTYRSINLIGAILLSLLFVQSVVLWMFELSITYFHEGLYVSFGHLLLFGHQIYEIESTVLIWTLTITSIIGVALQGLALQWAFSKGEVLVKRFKHRQSESKDC